MRAAVIREWGTAPELVDFEEPRGGPGEIAVDVLAGGLNPIDLLTWSGRFPGATRPLGSVIGREGVVATAPGRRLYIDGPVVPFGTFAERSLIDPERAFPVPDGVAAAAAVALGIAGLAAWVGLEWRGELAPGETVLVLGATGTVGLVAVQAAKLLGAGRVIAAGRSETGLARAAALGADATVRLEGDAETMAAAIGDAAEGDVDLVLDPLWGEPVAAALRVVGPGGRLVQIGHSAGTEAAIAAAPLRPKMVDIRAHGAAGVPLEVKREGYARMVAHLAAGELAVAAEEVPLAEVASAWERQARSPGRKLAIVP